MMSRKPSTNVTAGRPQSEQNIECILRLEQEDKRALSVFQRISHAIGGFVGTIHFLALQGVFTLLWMLLNSLWLPDAAAFDPYPYPLLSTVLALEAVVLTSFVLNRQNTNDEISERRNHLDLQINLLAEREATSTLNLLRAITDHFDIDVDHDPAHEELAENTEVENIARDLRSRESHR